MGKMYQEASLNDENNILYVEQLAVFYETGLTDLNQSDATAAKYYHLAADLLVKTKGGLKKALEYFQKAYSLKPNKTEKPFDDPDIIEGILSLGGSLDPIINDVPLRIDMYLTALKEEEKKNNYANNKLIDAIVS